MQTTLSDHSAAAARAKALIDEHSDNLRADRANEPGRYATGMPQSATASLTAGMLRGPPKPVQPQEVEAAQVRFQEVRVTAVDRNIAQLRASRDQALAGGTSFMSSQQGGGPAAASDAALALAGGRLGDAAAAADGRRPRVALGAPHGEPRSPRRPSCSPTSAPAPRRRRRRSRT